jgi:hypothetical protein
MSKYVRNFKSFRNELNSSTVNEDILGIGGALKELFGKLWQKGVEEIKKLGKNPSPEQLKGWIDKNVLNPADDTYILKGVIDTFTKKPEANEQDCLDLIKNILDPQVGSLGKGGMQSLYDNLLKNLGKESATLDIVKFYMETIRNRAIKDFKYAGGPDLKVGTDAKVDDKKVIVDMKDQTHLPVYKKAILAAQQDNKKRKQIAIDWVNKTLLTSLKKYFTEIKDEDVDVYLKSVGKEAPEGVGEIKPGESVIYKREKFSEDEWKKLTDDDKKKPGEGKMKELEDKEMIGIKKVKAVNGDEVSFEDADFKKTTGDILGKVEGEKAEGQDDLVKTLGELKTKNPEAITKMGDVAKLYQDPDANKDKIAEIEKLLGGEEGK